MRILPWQGKVLLLALLAMFAVPSLAQADHGNRGRNRARVQVYAEFGSRDYRYRDNRYYDDYRYRDLPGRRVGWRGRGLPPGLAKKHCNDGYVYSSYPRYPRSGRRGSVTIHIPF